jgi:hypothetical protein
LLRAVFCQVSCIWDESSDYVVRQDSWEPEQNILETLIREYEDEQDRAKAARRAARKAAAAENGSPAAVGT